MKPFTVPAMTFNGRSTQGHWQWHNSICQMSLSICGL